MPKIQSTTSVKTVKRTVFLSKEEIKKIKEKENKNMKKFVNSFLHESKNN